MHDLVHLDHVESNSSKPKQNMSKTHHPIAGSKFSASTLRRLAKKNLFLVSATWITGTDGSYANGETAFLVSDGRMLTLLQVLKASN
jgi:hypothetical protein